ncbi:MAG: hypothetical protein KAS72_09815 [Phycisphaerales bacterium]|nr:hypothetical protein [Phycisphaerales bacterium]
MRSIFLTFAASVSLAGVVLAGPLDKSLVDADAMWLMHVDIEAAVQSKVFAMARDHGELRAELDEAVAEFQEELGLNPLEDFMGVTIYGVGCDESDVVAIITTTDKADQVIAMLDEELSSDEHRVVTAGDYTVHIIGDGGDGDDRVYACIQGAEQSSLRRAYIAGDMAALLDGLAVAEHRRPSLAGTPDAELRVAPEMGSIFVAVVTSLDELPEVRPASHLARYAQSLQLDVGEHHDAVYVRAAAVAESAENAQDMSQAVLGLLAIARMAAAERPELGPVIGLLQSVQVQTDDTRITVRLEMPVDELAQLAREAHELEEDGTDEP